MKQSTALACAATLAISVACGTAAAASASKLAAHTPRPTIPALSLGGGEDDGGGLPGGRVAHGTIGSTPPAANAAGSLLALGGEDGSEADDGGALPGGGVAHGSIGKTPPNPKAASHLRALRGGDS